MHGFRWLLPLALALVVSLGIRPAPTAATPDIQPPAEVRVVHALPGAPPVDVFVDGVPAVPALGFGVNPPYATVPPGPHAISLVPQGGLPLAPLVAAELVFNPGVAYTVVAIQAVGAPPVLLTLPDEPANPLGGPAQVRFVHASPDTPPIDLALSGGPVLFGDIAFSQASPYLPVPAGTVDLEARLVDTPAVVLNIPAVVLAPGRAYTFMAIGLSRGAPPLGVLSLSDL
jgi:hypothetical protein